MKRDRRLPVLVVDDDEAIRETLRFMLEDTGYAVFEAPDGAAALALLRASRKRMVVLLDYIMPDPDGAAVLRTAAGHNSLGRHAFMLITASPNQLPLEIGDLLHRLAVPVIAKPFDVDALLSAIEQAGRRLEAADTH